MDQGFKTKKIWNHKMTGRKLNNFYTAMGRCLWESKSRTHKRKNRSMWLIKLKLLQGKNDNQWNLGGNIYNPNHWLRANLSKLYKLLQIAKKWAITQMEMSEGHRKGEKKEKGRS